MYVRGSEVDFGSYQFIVVGTGPAAYALAERLNARDKKAILLETGLKEYTGEIHDAYSRMYGRGHFDGTYWSNHSIRSFGGTSAVWGGHCTTLSERNLESWPISRRELDPYYEFAAGLLGRAKSILYFSAGFIDDFAFRPISAATPLNISWKPELLESLGWIDIALGTTLAALHPSDDRRAVTAFSLHFLDGSTRRVELQPRQSVILAAGAAGNVQILLNSQDGSSAAVGNENDQVGRYLMEHPHAYAGARVIAPGPLPFPALPADYGEPRYVIEPSDELISSWAGLDVSLEFIADSIDMDDPVEAYLAGRLGQEATAYSINVRSEMTPDPENRFVLGEGTTPAGLRRLQAYCYVGTDALRTMDSCLVAFGERLARSGPARVRILNEEIVRGVTGGGHTIGTTRMGTSPASSVVDADCRVHGYRNLYVAGSSVFPTGGYANPTLTLMALAGRLADKLMGDQA